MNILKKKLIEEEKIIQEEHQKKLKKMKNQALIFGGVGIFIFLTSLGVYVLPKFFELQEVKAEITQIEKHIDELELEKVTGEQNLKELEIKKAQLEKKYGKVFPIILPEVYSAEDYQRSLNRIAIFFEDFSIHYNKGTSPLKLPSLSFGSPKEVGDVFMVPIRMSIESSNENFKLFLDQINTRSGSLDEEDFYLSSLTQKKEPIPVMSIDSLNISLPQTNKSSLVFFSQQKTEAKIETLTFSVSLSAYFRATDYMKSNYGSVKKK